MDLKTEKTLDSLKLDEIEGNWREIDALHHAGIAKVVVSLQDDNDEYMPGAELARRIVALPELIAAFRDISNCADMSIYDVVTRARTVLKDAGIRQ